MGVWNSNTPTGLLGCGVNSHFSSPYWHRRLPCLSCTASAAGDSVPVLQAMVSLPLFFDLYYKFRQIPTGFRIYLGTAFNISILAGFLLHVERIMGGCAQPQLLHTSGAMVG